MLVDTGIPPRFRKEPTVPSPPPDSLGLDSASGPVGLVFPCVAAVPKRREVLLEDT